MLGLQQVAIGGLDRSALKNLWCNELGLHHVGYFESEVRRGVCYIDVVVFGCTLRSSILDPLICGDENVWWLLAESCREPPLP